MYAFLEPSAVHVSFSLNFVVLPFPVGVSSHLTAIKTLSFAVTRVVADVRVTNTDSFWSAVA